MNTVRQIQALNKRELENAVPPEASWHADYRDTAYIYIGGLPYELSEGDIITIFSQYGEPVHVNLVRDKETGKSKGFAFLKYEDQRSTDLAVDNLCGATVLGRVLRVDHCRYKRHEDEGEEDNVAAMLAQEAAEKDQHRRGGADDTDTETERRDRDRERRHRRRRSESVEEARPVLPEERELAKLIEEHDDEDPMKEFLIQEKKEEVARALERYKKSKSSRRRDESRDRDDRRRRHRRHHHHHRRRHSQDRSESRHRERRGRDRSLSRSRSPSRDRRRRDRSTSRHRTSHRDRSPRRDRYRDRSRSESRDRYRRDRDRSRSESLRDRYRGDRDR
ncbi:hypothetical protein VTN31DRAFT_4804 [Thermomyces dupontii]|uniref:uncharacterized protein n=1 Tax=Talaromyces thermophilus TaxID=28565 RepID=UPI0037423D17